MAPVKNESRRPYTLLHFLARVNNWSWANLHLENVTTDWNSKGKHKKQSHLPGFNLSVGWPQSKLSLLRIVFGNCQFFYKVSELQSKTTRTYGAYHNYSHFIVLLDGHWEKTFRKTIVENFRVSKHKSRLIPKQVQNRKFLHIHWFSIMRACKWAQDRSNLCGLKENQLWIETPEKWFRLSKYKTQFVGWSTDRNNLASSCT